MGGVRWTPRLRTDRAGRRDHSIPVDVELEEKEPTEIIYHGTEEKFVASIVNKVWLTKEVPVKYLRRV